MKTIVGLVADQQQANVLLRELADAGFRDEDIDVIRKESENDEDDIFQTIVEFFGSEEYPEVRSYYSEGLQRGGVLVSVFAEDEEAERAAEVMIRNGALDIDKWARHWKERQVNPRSPTTQLGQPSVWFGKVRVYSHSVQQGSKG